MVFGGGLLRDSKIRELLLACGKEMTESKQPSGRSLLGGDTKKKKYSIDAKIKKKKRKWAGRT